MSIDLGTEESYYSVYFDKSELQRINFLSDPPVKILSPLAQRE